MKRLFIEIDKADDHVETLAYLGSSMHGLEPTESFFDTVLDEALMKTRESWEAVKAHDEIYCSTALIPRFGMGSSLGSGSLFNALMFKAIEEGTEGKKIFMFREYSGIRWYELKRDLVDKAFRKNYLYTKSEDGESWEQVDIDKLINEELDAD